jgi:nucleoside-diphosphate-sugar epimerase
LNGSQFHAPNPRTHHGLRRSRSLHSTTPFRIKRLQITALSTSSSPEFPAIGSVALIAGCGYVGLRVARLWASLGVRTFAITRSTEKAEHLLSHGIHPIVADLSLSNVLPSLPDADVVLWSVGFDYTQAASREALWIDGLKRLVLSIPEHRAPRRILYTSSTSVYGTGDGRDVDEDTVVNPDSEGGKACVAAEVMLREHGRMTGDCVSIIRLAGLYGPDRLLRRIDDLRRGVPFTTPPDECLNLVHVEDVVRTIDVIRRCDAPPALLNAVAAGRVTRRDWYSRLADLMDAPSPVFEQSHSASARPARGGNRRVVSRVRPQLPVIFQFDDWEAGLRHAVENSGTSD